MAKKIPLSLWRMWDHTDETTLDHLSIHNFLSEPKYGSIGRQLPRLAQKALLTSDMLKGLKRVKPKIVHLQNPNPAIEFEAIAKQCQKDNIKVVASTHGFQEIFDPHYGFDKWYQRMGWKLLLRDPLLRSFKHVDAFLVGFPAQRKFLSDLGVPDQKMHLVPNGIDPYFDQIPTAMECISVEQKFGLSKESPTLLFMGNHTLNKGLGTLIKLATTLSTPATIVIGGKLLEGEPDKWLQGVELASGVRIIFTDFLSVAEQRALYHVSKVFIFPSVSETLPLVVLEAMAAGLPVVAFDTGGVSFQLAEGGGVTVPLGDFTTYKAAVERLITDPVIHDKVSKASRQRQADLFSWSKLADKTIAVYNSLSTL